MIKVGEGNRRLFLFDQKNYVIYNTLWFALIKLNDQGLYLIPIPGCFH